MKLKEVFKELVKENTCINCGNIVNEDASCNEKRDWIRFNPYIFLCKNI